MNTMKRLFGGLDVQYMIRAYILGAIFFAIVTTMTINRNAGAGEVAVVLGYFGLCTLLFPFAKLVWDRLKAIILGETFLILPIVFLYPAKIMVNAFLWGFALFVAPFGMAYIWFQTKGA